MYHAKFCMHETSLKYEIIYFLLLHVSTDHHKTTIGPTMQYFPIHCIQITLPNIHSTGSTLQLYKLLVNYSYLLNCHHSSLKLFSYLDYLITSNFLYY